MGRLSLLFKVFAFALFSLIFSGEASAVCWEPYGVDEPIADDSKGNKKNKEGRGNRGGGSSSDYTTNSGECDTDEPTPTPGTAGTPTVSVTNSTSGSYTVSWSAASNMDTSGTGQQGYELLEYKNGSFVKTYYTSPTTRTQSISNNPDGNYQYKVRGCNTNINMGVPVCGNYSSLSSTNYVRHKPSKPSAPSPSSSTSTSSLTLTMSKPSGNVAFYRIQKRKDSGSWVWADSNHANNSKTISGLTDGSWDFRFNACNDYTWACSSYSADSSNVTVRNKPSVPTPPAVADTTVTNGSISISWTKPSGSVSMYDVIEYKAGVSGYNVVANDISATSLSLTGRSSGDYTYRVRACNGYGWSCSGYSSYSAAAKVRLLPSKPAVPTVSSTTSTGSVSVSWSKPSGTVSFYRIQKRLNSGSWSWADSSHSTTSLSVSGLTEGSWDFRVQACNGYSWACSSYSTDSANVTVHIPPSTPAAPSINDTTVNGSVTVSWVKPSGNVSLYRLQKRKNNGSWTWADSNHSSTSKTVTGLTDGSWDFRVRACNGGTWSCSSYSADSANTTVRIKPSVPVAPSISDTTVTNGTISISWTKPSGAVTMYDVLEYKSGVSGYTVVANDTTSTSLTLTGRNDGDYTYRVRACNGYSWACSSYSSHSLNVFVRPLPAKPATPTLSSATSTGDVTVSWSKPSGSVSFYQIQKRKDSGSWTLVSSNTGGTSYNVTGLSDGSWDFRVRACNDYSWACSSYSADSVNTTVRVKPSVPAAPIVPSATSTDGTISISWSKPNGTVSAYDVIEYKSGQSGYSVVGDDVTSTSLAVSGRSDGSYTYRVRACNEFSWSCSGYSSHSASITVLHKPGVPASISGPTLTDVDGSHTITWGVASGQVDSYELRQRFKPYGSSSFGSWSTAYNSTGRSKYFSLLSDGEYDYAVRACNASGCSNFKYISPHVTVTKPPYTPSVNVDSSSDDGSYTVSWQSGGGIVDEYSFAESPNYDSWVSVGTTTSRVISGKGDGGWSYKVKACNTSGCSGNGLSNTVTVNHPTPDRPMSISVPVETAETSYNISWAASTSNVADIYQISKQHESNGWSGWVTVSGTSAQITVDKAGGWTHRVRACNQLPDLTQKCSSARESDVVNVHLPPDWAKLGGDVADKTYGHNEGLTSDQTVGAVEGNGGVSGGAATYSIPIVIPPGRKGMQPNISLNYSSRSGNGIAGVGWSLSAGSAISRCAATSAQDVIGSGVTYGSKDKLCLDGQRLIVVNGAYGISGAEYRTELDSFAKIVQSGAMDSPTAWFTVYHKNNRKSVYGTTADSKHTASGREEILSWAIANTQDPSGNTISYDYYNYSNGENLLKTIYYTGNNGSNGDREIRFKYDIDARPDTSRSYMAGGLTTSSKRLEKIQTVYQTQIIREYELTYETSPFTERSLLKEITECADNVCLKPTKVRSYKPNYSWANTGSSSSANKKLEEIGKMVEPGDKLYHIDLNGDGVLEVIYSRFGLMQNDDDPVRTVIYARNDFGDYEEKANNTFIPLTAGDMNLDGITDLIYVDQSTNKIGYKQYNDSFQVESNITNIPAPSNHFHASVKQLDVNNDGYPDLIYRDYTSNEIKYYLRASNGSLDFTGPYIFTTMRKREPVAEAHIREEPSYMDIDGDGYLDVLKTYLSDDNVLEVSVSFGGISNNRWVATNKSASQLGLPTNNFANQHFFADLNGDGLRDFIRPVKVSTHNFDWRVRLNKGDRTFSSESSLGTGVGIHEHRTRYRENGFVNKVQSKWGGATFADFDNDGKDELFTPTHSDDDLCTNFVGVPPSQSTWEPYSIEVCNDDMHIEDKIALKSNPNIDIYIDFGRYDIRRFKWSIVDFEETSSGLKYSRTTPDVVEAPISGFNSLDMEKSWSPIELKDIDNDGLIDFSYRTVESYSYSHCNPPPQGVEKQNCYLYVAGQPYHHAVLGVGFRDGTPPINAGYFEQKNLIGKNAGDGKLADTVYEIENGLGVKIGWDYAPLSKHINRPSNANKFYDVPGSENRYTLGDSKHFMFTSSMYLVSDSYHSNGLGDENQKRYSYSEAVYNRMGRGFQGFRSIAVDDLASGIRSVTDFHQKFPKAGKIESARTCLIADNDVGCSPLTSALSQTDITYHIKDTVNSKVKWVYPAVSTKQSFDLKSRSTQLSEEVTTIGDTSNDVDNYGNILRSTKTLDNGFEKTKVVTTKTYAVNTEDWWLNKITSSKTETSKVIPSTIVTRAPGTDGVKWSESTYSYNTQGDKHRVPTTTQATASSSSLTHKVVIDNLNTYGLPTSVTTTGGSTANTGSDLTRKTITTYSDDGYFPKIVTNEEGHKITTIVAPKHGQPTSVTDVDNGITVTHTYDVFGRLKSSTVPGGKLIEKGLQWCTYDCSEAPAEAKYYEFTQQEGSPTVKIYKDHFNRTLMTESSGFGGEAIFTRVEYDKQGRKTLETQPSFYSSNELGTRYESYDALGRLTEKKTDQANSGLMITTYDYQGHQTAIEVTDQGRTLRMSRTYGGDGKLIQTTDAELGETRYAYDSMGNPITLQDANGNSIHAWYNGFGHKWKVEDPNMGIKTFSYNTFGEVESETDANNDTLTMSYDGLGRLLQRKVNGSLQASFDYITPNEGASGTFGVGQLQSETSPAGITKNYLYDRLSRPSVVETIIDGTSYASQTQYDGNFGRIKSYTYPSGITVGYDYDNYGYQTRVLNAKTGFEYQKITERDALMNITEAYKNANSLRETRTYSEATGQLRIIDVKTASGETTKHNLTYWYKSFGNLDWQEQFSPSGVNRESFWYDGLHRLIRSSRDNGEEDITYAYDAVGNFTAKSDYATNYIYSGSGGPNAVSSVDKYLADGSTTSVSFDYDANGNMISGDGKSIDYNAFNKPIVITAGGVISTFEYGADLARFRQIKGTETTTYLGKEVEIVKANSKTTTKTYIGDIAVVSKEATVGQVVPDHKLRFTHRDRLGSPVTLTDHNNNITEQRGFDPFGKPRNDDMSDAAIPTLLGTNGGFEVFSGRGFTDHEHLEDAELIHMNGRVYDYHLGRFLSVDPFIQAPGNSQSMNPYSYIMNNPLAGTDPSGYKWEVLWEHGDGLDKLKQVLTQLGFEVSNGYVHFNSKNTASWDSVEKIEGPDFSDELKTQVAKSTVTRRLAKLGIAISGSTSQEDINRMISSITGRHRVSNRITEYGNTYESIIGVDAALDEAEDISDSDYAAGNLKVLSGLMALEQRQIAESSKGFSKARLWDTRFERARDAYAKQAIGMVGGITAIPFVGAGLLYAGTAGAPITISMTRGSLTSGSLSFGGYQYSTRHNPESRTLKGQLTAVGLGVATGGAGGMGMSLSGGGLWSRAAWQPGFFGLNFGLQKANEGVNTDKEKEEDR